MIPQLYKIADVASQKLCRRLTRDPIKQESLLLRTTTASAFYYGIPDALILGSALLLARCKCQPRYQWNDQEAAVTSFLREKGLSLEDVKVMPPKRGFREIRLIK